MMDIIMGNNGKKNQLLHYHDNGSYSEDSGLPGGEMDTISLTVGDVNGDGMLDIIVGHFWYQKNQLLVNDGNGTFSKVLDLPGGKMNTYSIAAADVNGDGKVDIIFGNGINYG